VTSQDCRKAPKRGLVRRLRERRNERGVAAVEMALVGTLLITLALGGGEYGLLMSSKHDLNVATRLAGRVASSPCATTGNATLKGILLDPTAPVPAGLDTRPRTGGCEENGNTEYDDFYILRAIESGLSGKMADVEKVIIYKGSAAEVLSIGKPPSICLSSTTGENALCNVYTKDTPLQGGTSSQMLLKNLDSFYVQSGSQQGALIGQKLKDNFACNGGLPSKPFCPTGMIDVTVGTNVKHVPIRLRNIANPTPLGIYIKMKHQFVTGFFRDSQSLSDWTVFRLEPSPKVNETQKDPCSGSNPPAGCHKYPSVSVFGTTVTESPTTPNCANVHLTMSPPQPVPESVTLTTSDGTATAATDYVATSVTVNFAANQTTATVCIPIKNDNVWESTEKFTVTIGGPSAGLLDDQGKLQGSLVTDVTILDDETQPKLTVNDIIIDEGQTKSFTVSLDAVSDTATTFSYVTIDQGAIAPGDYQSLILQTGTIPAGSLSVSIPVTANNDANAETDEKFELQLSSISPNATWGASQVGTATIKDKTVFITVDDISIPEGQWKEFTVSIDKLSATDVTFNYKTVAGNATEILDYDLIALTPGKIAAGSLSIKIKVQTKTDSSVESDEVFWLPLTGIVGAANGASQTGKATIVDNTPDLSITPNITVDEGTTGSFTVSLNKASTVPVDFDFYTVPGTATEGVDYTKIALTHWTIPVGSTSYSIPVSALLDLIGDDNETFTVKLLNITGAGPGATTIGTATINDVTPDLTIDSITLPEGTSKAFTVSLNKVSSVPVTFKYQSFAGSATQGVDYTAVPLLTGTIPAGSLSTTITVDALADSLTEPTETYTVQLSNVVGAGNSIATGTASITDTSPAIVISIGNPPSAVLESVGVINFPITLSHASTAPISIKYSTFNGTAIGGTCGGTIDFKSQSNKTLTIPAGSTSISLPITICADSIDELQENFTVTISSPSSSTAIVPTIGTPTGTGLIDDDDAAPTITVNSASANEGSTITFTVTLSVPTYAPVTVSLAAIAGTATTADYGALSATTITIPAGSTSYTVTIPTINDGIIEGNETFTVKGTVTAGPATGPSTGTMTIIDNDFATTTTIATTTTKLVTTTVAATTTKAATTTVAATTTKAATTTVAATTTRAATTTIAPTTVAGATTTKAATTTVAATTTKAATTTVAATTTKAATTTIAATTTKAPTTTIAATTTTTIDLYTGAT
jgi:hypothetical protein